MKILITGSNGFIGKNLIKSTKLQEYTLLTPSSQDLNLLNFNQTNIYIKQHQPTIVINLAGKVGGIFANINFPGQFIYENITTAFNLIECNRLYNKNLIHFIQIGSACMYPIKVKQPYKENDVFNGEPEPTNSSYAYAKRSILKCLQDYYQQYQLPYTYIIPCNMYGPYDNFNQNTSHVIPAIFNKINDNIITMFGNPNTSREFLYVEDLIKFIEFVLLNPLNIHINIGSNENVTIIELVQFIQNLYHKTQPILFNNQTAGASSRNMCLDRIFKLGFQSDIDIKTGLKLTKEWKEQC